MTADSAERQGKADGTTRRGTGSDRPEEWDLFDPDTEAPRRLRIVGEAALDRNARNPVVLDLRGLSDATDYFVIVTGDSDVHTRAIAENVLESVEQAGETPVGVEGQSAGRWILIDYVDIVVHIFLPSVREFYQLERLWGDAPRAVLEEERV